MTTIESGYMTLSEAAKYLRVTVPTLREWLRTKQVPHFKPGKDLLFTHSTLDKWMRRYKKGLHGLALTSFNGRAS